MPVNGKRLGELMLKKIRGLMAFISLVGLSLFLLNCGSSNSRPSGVLLVTSQGASTVGSYAIDLGNGHLSLINTTATTCPASPCGFPEAIVLDPTGATAFVLDQGAPSNSPPVPPMIYAYTVGTDGKLAATGSPVKVGTSLDADPLTADTATAMARDADGKFLFVVSQGAIVPPDGCATVPPPANGCPAISVFSMQSGSAGLSPVAGSPFILGRVPTSVAPVTYTISNSNPAVTKTLLYVTANEDLGGTNDNTVSVFNVDSSGVLTPQTIPTYATASNPSAVLALNLTPTGGASEVFVYVTNVTTNNINVFQVCTVVNADCTQADVDTAKMTAVGSPVSVGQDPVAFTVDSTKNFMYVVNRNSNSVSGFRVNQSTGGLALLNTASASTGTNPVALTLHPNGEFLYVSNSGSDNISAFTVSTVNGSLGTLATVTSSAQPAGLVAK
jgi:hypothetical protein